MSPETAGQQENIPGTEDTPMIAAPTGDGYQQALRELARRAQEFLDTEDADSRDLFRHAQRLSKEIREHNLQPREKLTRTEVHHNALRRFIDAIYEFVDLEDHDGQLVSADRVWEEFARAVRSAAHTAEAYGPDDTTWAPEDDTNPVKTTPVPEPDPTAEPINGVRQGDYVKSKWDAEPRRVLTGVIENKTMGPSVRLSDPRDGTWFGGYYVPPEYLGREYALADQHSSQRSNASPEPGAATASPPRRSA